MAILCSGVLSSECHYTVSILRCYAIIIIIILYVYSMCGTCQNFYGRFSTCDYDTMCRRSMWREQHKY